jgi:MFS family permease
MRTNPIVFIAAMCLAHLLTMLGFSTFPTLLPQFTALWGLSGVEAGAINSALFLGYTVSVPVLVSLTDRVDARAIYLVCAALGAAGHLGFAFLADGALSAGGFTALYGVALAGTYMPGLRILGEHLPAEMMSRATGFYTASFGLGAGGSFILSDHVAAMAGWSAMYMLAGGFAVLAMIVVVGAARPVEPHVREGAWLSLLDPRPVLANRSVMAYSLCYAVHNYELFTVRSWLVAFLAMSAAQTGANTGGITPAIVAASMTFIGVLASISGNEVSIRTGRRRAISWAMSVSALVALGVAWSGGVSYWLCGVLAMVHGITIMLDSSSLTAGAFASARPDQRGITMAVHSTLGFGGAMLGPLIFGLLVDAGGEASGTSWSIAYGHMALVLLVGPIIMAWLKPQGAPGDRKQL